MSASPNLVLGLEVVRPDEVWVADLTYVRLQQEFVYLAIIMDVFTRCIRGWHLERHLGQELTLTAGVPCWIMCLRSITRISESSMPRRRTLTCFMTMALRSA